MDRTLVLQFQRVEKALATLISSIATYNPNPAFAQELVEADASLNGGLEELIIHQANYARIQALKAQSNALDNEIRTTLQTLSTTRAELITTPATVFSADIHPIKYRELLSYARRISKFTLPPAYRETAPEATAPAASAAPTNGTTTPVANGATPAGTTPLEPEPATAQATDKTALPAFLDDWMNPLKQMPGFVPWPTEETLRRGALGTIQALVDAGEDPATFDPEKKAREEEEQKRLEEEEEKRKVQHAEKERVRMEQAAKERQAAREAAAARGEAPVVQEKPKVYSGLDMLEDDSDDE